MTAPAAGTTRASGSRLRRAQRQGGATVLALAALAWMLLLAWDLSPYGRFLDHDALADSGLGAGAVTALFVGGWVLMLAAMMFPTTYTLIETFTPVARRRGPARRLIGSLLGGYVAAWTVVGLAAFGADVGIHAAVEASDWLHERAWLLAVVGLAAAGAYQFSSFKDRCLTVCRSPQTFIFARWRGKAPALEAFLLGVDAGRYCIGCCAGLMLVTFAVGMGNLGWMLLLGAVMAAEKLWSRGDRLTAPLGSVLLTAAALTVLVH